MIFREKVHFYLEMSSKNIGNYHSKSTWSILSEKVRKSVILANFCVLDEKVVQKQCKLLSQTHFGKVDDFSKYFVKIFFTKITF